MNKMFTVSDISNV